MSSRRNKLPPPSRPAAKKESATAKKESTNFNTSNMKVCFFDIPKNDNEAVPFDSESMMNLLKAADFALRRAIKKDCNVDGFVVVNPCSIFGQEQFGALYSHFKTKNVTKISAIGDVLTLKTKENYVVSIQLVGGARFVETNNQSDGDDESTDSSSFEDATNMNMTQECAGVFKK